MYKSVSRADKNASFYLFLHFDFKLFYFFFTGKYKYQFYFMFSNSFFPIFTGGPKNYTFTTAKGETCCKVRGFSLNYKNSDIINFESMRELITTQESVKFLTIETERKICVEGKCRKVFNRKETKKYRTVYDKRILVKNFKTFPFGFKH